MRRWVGGWHRWLLFNLMNIFLKMFLKLCTWEGMCTARLVPVVARRGCLGTRVTSSCEPPLTWVLWMECDPSARAVRKFTPKHGAVSPSLRQIHFWITVIFWYLNYRYPTIYRYSRLLAINTSKMLMLPKFPPLGFDPPWPSVWNPYTCHCKQRTSKSKVLVSG